MTTLLFAIVIVSAAFIGLGITVFFFGKTASREVCGTVPEVQSHEDCPSLKMGICPVEDTSGLVKLASQKSD